MTTNVADEVIGKFARQQHDWFERVRKGSLDPEQIMHVVQNVIDSRAGPFLRSVYTILLPASENPFNADEYYQNRKGLYIEDKFHNLILSATSPIKSVPAMELAISSVVKTANDDDIHLELPRNHVFENTSIFCAHLGAMIDCQLNGKDGNLLSNGYVNIFYVYGVDRKVFVVRVFGDTNGRDWSVGVDFLHDYGQSAGVRVFSEVA